MSVYATQRTARPKRQRWRPAVPGQSWEIVAPFKLDSAGHVWQHVPLPVTMRSHHTPRWTTPPLHRPVIRVPVPTKPHPIGALAKNHVDSHSEKSYLRNNPICLRSEHEPLTRREKNKVKDEFSDTSDTDDCQKKCPCKPSEEISSSGCELPPQALGLFLRESHQRQTRRMTTDDDTPSKRDLSNPAQAAGSKTEECRSVFQVTFAHVDDKHRNTRSRLGVMLPDVSPAVNHIKCTYIELIGLERGPGRGAINPTWKSAINFGSFTSRRVSLASWQGPPIPR